MLDEEKLDTLLMAQKMLDNFHEMVKVVRTGHMFLMVRPEPKQSTSFDTRKKGKKAFTSRRKEKYVTGLAEQIKKQWNQPKIMGRVRITALYSFPWRSNDKVIRMMLWDLMSTAPDIDNLYKPLADAMEKICFDNDSRVVCVQAMKIRSDKTFIAIRLDEIMPRRTKV